MGGLASLTPQGQAASAGAEVVKGLAAGGPSSATSGNRDTGFGAVTFGGLFEGKTGTPPPPWLLPVGLGIAALLVFALIIRRR